MQANDNNENEDGALEALALLEQQNPYQGAPIHREEQFRDSNLVNSETFDESSLWKPFATSSDAYAALELESFVNTKKNGIYQIKNGGTQCRVVCRGDNGRIKWNKALKKHQPISNRRNAHICSYHAYIRKVRKKDDQPYWIIDPKHTKLEHSKRCLLGTRRCPGVTTVRKRILKNLDTVRAFTDRKTLGREVMSSIQVNSQAKVTDVHAKRAWKESNGANPKDVRESFTRIDHLINYMEADEYLEARAMIGEEVM